MAGIRLVPLTPEQAAEVATWFGGDEEGQRRFGGFYGVHPKWWDLVRTDSCRHGWVAVVDGDAVGFVDIETSPGSPAHLAYYVRLEQRGQRLCVALARAAIAQARLLGAKSVSAAIEPDNAASLACCRRVGFVDAGTNEHGDLVLQYQLR